MMNENETLRDRLVVMAQAELEAYRESVLKLPPAGVMDHSYEIITKEDLLIALEEFDFNDDELAILLETGQPLDELYQHWLQQDTGYMDMLRGSIGDYILAEQNQEAERQYADPQTPVLGLSYMEARATGRGPEFLADHKRDLACKMEFQKGINEVYHTPEIKLWLHKLAEAYGLQRLIYVLARTPREDVGDQRYSPAVRQRVDRISYPQAFSRDFTADYRIDTHPSMINAALSELMKLERQREKNTDKQQGKKKIAPER